MEQHEYEMLNWARTQLAYIQVEHQRLEDEYRARLLDLSRRAKGYRQVFDGLRAIYGEDAVGDIADVGQVTAAPQGGGSVVVAETPAAVDPDGDDGAESAGSRGDFAGKTTRQALQALAREWAGRRTTTAEMLEQIVQRGWDVQSENPGAVVRTAIKRMVRDGELIRLSRGLYEVPVLELREAS